MASDVVVTVASKGVAEVVDDFKKVEKAAEGAAPAARNLSKGIDSVGESGGNAERALQGVADITGFLGEQVGINLGPLNDYAGAFAQLGGGVEAALQGGPALLAQLKALPGTLAGAIAATWAYVSALVAQAAAFIAANAPLIAIIAGLALLTAGVILVIKYWDEIVAHVPFLGTAIEAVKGVITPAIDAITAAFQAVLTWLQSNWPIVATIISGPFAPIVLLATDAFGVRSALQGAFEGVLGWVRSNWPEIATVISGPFAPIVLLATDAFGVKSALIDAFSSAISAIRDMGGTAWEAARVVGSNIADGIANGVSGIINLADSIGGYVIGAIKGAVNSAQLWLHENVSISIPGLDPPGPGSIPGFSWNFPLVQFAQGGIVNRATLAMIGESGPEAVIPLGQIHGIMSNAVEDGVTAGLQTLAEDRANELGLTGGNRNAFIEGYLAARTGGPVANEWTAAYGDIARRDSLGDELRAQGFSEREIAAAIANSGIGGNITQAIVTDFAEGMTTAARTPGTFDAAAEGFLDAIDRLAITPGLEKTAAKLQEAFDEFYYLAATPQGQGYLARQGGHDTSFYYDQIGYTQAYHGGLFPGMAGYSGGGGISSLQRRYIDRMGGLPSGGMNINITALDAQGVRDWLNRGGGQQIMKWVQNQKSFA